LSTFTSKSPRERRLFIGGSDARFIMGDDMAALVRLWREKRGEAEPEDLSENLIVQLGTTTEDLNRRWYERNTGHAVGSVQSRIIHPIHKWLAATLDGLVDPGGAVFEAKFMLPFLPASVTGPLLSRALRRLASTERSSSGLRGNNWLRFVILLSDAGPASQVRSVEADVLFDVACLVRFQGRDGVRSLPKACRDGKRIDPKVLPPGPFTVAPVQFPMVQPADRNGELVADHVCPPIQLTDLSA